VGEVQHLEIEIEIILVARVVSLQSAIRIKGQKPSRMTWEKFTQWKPSEQSKLENAPFTSVPTATVSVFQRLVSELDVG